LRKSLIYSSILMALILLSFGLVSQAFSQSSQQQNLKVINYSWYIYSGVLVVVGTVQNVGPTILQPVLIGGIIYTPDETAQVWSNPCRVYASHMIPQQTAPFLMEFPSTDLSWLSQGIDHIDFQTIQADANDTYQYQDLTIASSKLAADSEGVYWVTGTIQNIGTTFANKVRVNAAFYNSSGTVVAVGYSPDSYNISSSDSASFRAGAFDVNKTETSPDRQITSCTLWIYCESPLLSGTPPSPKSFGSTVLSTTDNSSTDSNSNNNGSNNSSNDNSSNPAAPGLNYAAIIAIIVVVIVAALVYLRIKSRKTSTAKTTKPQAVGKRGQSARRRRDA